MPACINVNTQRLVFINHQHTLRNWKISTEKGIAKRDWHSREQGGSEEEPIANNCLQSLYRLSFNKGQEKHGLHTRRRVTCRASSQRTIEPHRATDIDS